MKNVLDYIKAISPLTLLSSILSALVGASLAYHFECLNIIRFVLVLVGLVLVHSAVNLYNDYCDYLRGVDVEYRRRHALHRMSIIIDLGVSPIRVKQCVYVLVASALAIAVALMIMIRNVVPILVLLAIGLLIGLGYSGLKLRYYGLGEILAGIAVGPLVTAGAYIAISGTVKHIALALVLGVPNGMFTSMILILIGIARLDIDRELGKHTIAVKLGAKRALYVAYGLVALGYIILVALCLAKVLSYYALPALLTAPLAVRLRSMKKLFVVRSIVTAFICAGLIL